MYNYKCFYRGISPSSRRILYEKIKKDAPVKVSTGKEGE